MRIYSLILGLFLVGVPMPGHAYESFLELRGMTMRQINNLSDGAQCFVTKTHLLCIASGNYPKSENNALARL